MVAIDYLLFLFLEWLQPRNEIDLAPDFSLETYRRLCQQADKSSKEDDGVGGSVSAGAAAAPFGVGGRRT